MDEDKGSIDRLKTALYSREGLKKRRARRTLRNWGRAEETVPSRWAIDEAVEPPRPALFPGLLRHSIPSIILFASIAFFVVCVAIAAFFFLGGNNLISNKNIDIAISGPVASPGGQELSLQVAITNRNSVPLQLADFIVRYPDTARSSNDLSLPLGSTRESIGTIAPGETVNKNVRAVLFGKEGENQSLAMSLEYRVPGSNAIFEKDQTYNVLISSSPISVVEHGLEESVSGQPLTFTLDVTSNSPTPVANVMVTADYPFGFTFNDSSPTPNYANNAWLIGTLNPGETKEITVHGLLVGQQNEKRVFTFTPGIQSTKDPQTLQTVFNVVTDTVALAEPFLGASLSVNGAPAGTDFVAPAGQGLTASLDLRNNLSTQITNAEILVTLSGNAFNELTVNTPNGFYDSGTKTIRWTSETLPGLQTLDPGESFNVDFNVTPFDRINDTFLSDPALTFNVTVEGRRIGEKGVPETIQSTIVGHVKVSSNLNLASRAVYSTGPFPNVGPIPPKVNTETTYTTIWTLTNGANNVTNGVVSATLPSYVRWVGAVSPTGSPISYNPVSRKITWNVGNVLAQSGYTKPPTEVAFQIALTPSTSQLHQAPNLLGDVTFTGTDQYTGTSVTASARAIDTHITTDPSNANGDDLVVP
jgi:uncharacterized repeat protein (TIGR01451 family)